jgi:hypothetical protein
MGDGTQIATGITIINSLLGFQAISLSAMDTSSAPSIMAGSKVEIASAFFTFTSDDDPQASTWASITTGGTAYITLTPSGTAGSQIITAKWSGNAPVWSNSKQGWYASAASSIRYVAGCLKYASVSYHQKFILGNFQRNGPSIMYKDSGGTYYLYPKQTTVLEIGDWNMDTTTSKAVAHSFGSSCTIVGAKAFIRPDSGLGPEDVYKLDYVASGASTINGGIMLIDNAYIYLTRTTGGIFDSNAFDATSYNRGWVVLEFIP